MLVLTYAILCFAGISFFIIRTKLAQIPSSPFKEISTSIRPDIGSRDSLVQTSGEVNVIDPTRFLTPLIARYEDLPSTLRFRGQVRGEAIAHTWMLWTFWKRTYRSAIGLPSRTSSSLSSRVCAVSLSSTSSTSSKPIDGRFMKSFKLFGACAICSALVWIVMVRTRTF